MSNVGTLGSGIFLIYNTPVSKFFSLNKMLFGGSYLSIRCISLASYHNWSTLAFGMYKIDAVFPLLSHPPNINVLTCILTVPAANDLIGIFCGEKMCLRIQTLWEISYEASNPQNEILENRL